MWEIDPIIWKVWNLLPSCLSDEAKLIFAMSLPGLGKGSFFVIFGVWWLNFSLVKTLCLCTVGSFIKIVYYFPLVYVGERYAENYWFLVKNIPSWLEKKCAEKEAQQVNMWVILVLMFATMLSKYFFKKISQFGDWLEKKRVECSKQYKIYGIGSLFLIPIFGVGTFTGAFATCILRVGFFKGVLVTAVGIIVSNCFWGIFSPQSLNFFRSLF